MVTLHSYVLRELLKTFGLTLLALTVLFTMGGGLYNVVSYEGVSAADVFAFIPLLIPIVVTLTMPMAALFAATMVYGRLAADNELIACRAAGINIHKLFISVMLLSVFVALFTLLFSSFVIPGFIHQIESYARRNIRDLVANSLQRKGFVHRGRSGEDRYTLTAEQVSGVSEAALRAKGFEVDDDLQYMLIKNPTFMHVETNGELRRFAVANWGLCIFDTRPTPIEATLLVRDGRDFEIDKRAVVIRQQQFGPFPLELPAQVRLSTAALDNLFYWREHPWEEPELRAALRAYLRDLTRQQFIQYCLKQLDDGGQLVLHDDERRAHRIHAARAEPSPAGVVLEDVHVSFERSADERPFRYEAGRAELVVAPLGERLLIEIRLIQTPAQDVLEYNPRAGDYTEPRRKTTLSLDGALVPEAVYANMEPYTPAAVLDPNAYLPAEGPLADARISLQREAAHRIRKIVATIHFRLGYALSVLVTAIMGAALGVIFRGARALSAFALAMIPFFSVMILMVLGRQVAEDPNAHAFGPFVTWGGLLAVLVADLIILRAGVRR